MQQCKKFMINIKKTEMKKYLFLTLLIVAFSCSQNNEKESDDIVVKFKVENMSFAKVTIANKRMFEVVDLDKNGEGTCILQEDVLYANLYYGEESKNLFFKKGDHVIISFNGSNFAESVQFKGETTPILEYINSTEYPLITPNLLSGSLDETVSLIENRTEEATNMLESSNLEQDFPQFVKLEKEKIKYMYALNLIVYPMVYAMEDPAYRPDADYFSIVDSYMIEDESILEISTYREFLIESSLLFASRDNEGASSNNRTFARIEYIAQNYKNDNIKESLINEIAINHLMWNSKDDIVELKEIHDNYVTNPKLKADFDEVYNF